MISLLINATLEMKRIMRLITFMMILYMIITSIQVILVYENDYENHLDNDNDGSDADNSWSRYE